MLLAALRLIRWRGLLSLRRWRWSMLDLRRWRWSMLDLRRWRWSMLDLRRWRWSMRDLRRGRWSMLDLGWGLLRDRLGRSGMNNPGLRFRRMINLWRWRFDFLLLRLGLLG